MRVQGSVLLFAAAAWRLECACAITRHYDDALRLTWGSDTRLEPVESVR